jgi:hypothetical protein
MVTFWTKEKLDSIEANMNYGSSGPIITNPSNSSSNPFILTPEVAKSYGAAASWFQCTIHGSVYFVMSGTYSTRIIYKKNLLGNEVLKYTTTSGVSEIIIPEYGQNTYLVSVSGYPTANVSCTVQQHRDTNTQFVTCGAQWIHSEGMEVYNGFSYLYHELIWYLPHDRVSVLVDFISDDAYLSNMDNLLNGAVTAVMLAGTCVPIAQVQSLARVIAGLQLVATLCGMGAIDFQQDYIDRIRTAGGYNSSVHAYANGVKIDICKDAQGIRTYDVGSWSHSILLGAAGEIGTWTSNDELVNAAYSG